MSRNKKIILLILFGLLTIGCLRIGWWHFSPNPEDFPLPDDFFPETARVSDLHGVRDGVPSVTTSTQSIYFQEEMINGKFDRASYWVEEFHYLYQAERRYEGDIASRNYRYDYDTISAEVEWAERYYLACGYDISESRDCVFQGRYQHFNVMFSANIGDYFTFDEFLDVVYYIDEMFGEEIMQ
jgi:hypothetical protein